jgi:hypothetical protein
MKWRLSSTVDLGETGTIGRLNAILDRLLFLVYVNAIAAIIWLSLVLLLAFGLVGRECFR